MAFTGNFMCTSFKVELMTATHNFTNSTGNTFNIAMYDNSASFTAATTAYTATNEVSGVAYVAKGNALVNVTPTSTSTTAFTDFGDSTWSSSTITARGAMIFNDTASGDPSVVILDFGSDKSSSSGDFTIVFPTGDSTSAIIRIA
tara:strand:+ start:376 stop:810 length:435 start_codon:yes stop_codon:yes gene_type:complete